MSVSVTTNFDQAVQEIQQQFLQGKAEEVSSSALNARITHIAISLFAALGALALTAISLAAIPASFGFSIVLLVPAAGLALAAYETFRLARCFEIVSERAQKAKALFVDTFDQATWR